MPHDDIVQHIFLNLHRQDMTELPANIFPRIVVAEGVDEEEESASEEEDEREEEESNEEQASAGFEILINNRNSSELFKKKLKLF